MRRRLFKLLFPAEYKREQYRLHMERAGIVCMMMSQGGRDHSYSNREDLIDFITHVDPIDEQQMQAALNRLESRRIDRYTVHMDPAFGSGNYAFGFGGRRG